MLEIYDILVILHGKTQNYKTPGIPGLEYTFIKHEPTMWLELFLCLNAYNWKGIIWLPVNRYIVVYRPTDTLVRRNMAYLIFVPIPFGLRLGY